MSRIVQFPRSHTLRQTAQVPVFVEFSDVFLSGLSDAGSIGFLLAQFAEADKAILWAGDRQSFLEDGDLYMTSRMKPGFLHCTLPRAHDVLQAMEDGLGSSDLSAVVGEVWGEPNELTFTATKRLALRAEARGIPCVLIRHNAKPNLSAARNRFRIASLPSASNPDDPHAPGDPRWRVELFKSRSQAPGTWIVQHDRTADRLDFTPLASDGSVGADHGAAGRGTPG